MSKYKIIILLICFFFTTPNFGQSKNEKESKISKTDFPIPAQQTLSLIPEKAKRVKYYQERDGDKSSFECKFKLQRFWYSVEFDENGKLEDIEVRIRQHHLSKSIKTTITNYLSESCDKYDIVKIQEQYVHEGRVSDIEFFKSTLSNRNTTESRYELIIAIKNDKQWTLKEMTFDEEGAFTNSRDLQTDSYEYIMY